MRIPKLILAVTAVFALGGYECGDIIEDPGFDVWCGEQLCSWELEKGEIERVPTWHRRDYGVALLSDPTAISQLAVTSDDCIRFQFIADIAPDATVTVEMDLLDDGRVEWERQVPTSNWALLTYMVATPETEYRGIRFRIRKTGPGHAVLAEIEAVRDEGCVDPPIQVMPRPLGAACDEGADCDSGVCAPQAIWGGTVCSACDGPEDCAEGVCGLHVTELGLHLSPYRACEPTAARSFGERCALDSECTTGWCTGGVCSTCRLDEHCGDGRTCEERVEDPGRWLPAYQCSGAGDQPGGACMLDGDCASGACAGGAPLSICLWDGRPCETDADCPWDGYDADSGNGYCYPAGTAGGQCE